jgi:ABC-type multidrug transport system fused ATPase/permease subunit
VGAQTVYTERLAARNAAVELLAARAARVSTARIAVALSAIALVGAIVWMPLNGSWYWGVGLLAVAFIALVLVHASIFEEKERAIAARRFYERGLLRLNEKWQTLPSDGARFKEPDHPYADDLDLFGRASLFQLLDTTESRLGETHLAGLLTGSHQGAYPKDVLARQVAVRDLASRLEFRENLSAHGAVLRDDRPDPRPFLTWAEGAIPFVGTLENPGAPSSLLVAASYALPALTIAFFFLAESLSFPRGVALIPLALQLVILRSVGERVARIAAAVTSQERSVARYLAMLREVESTVFEGTRLVSLRARLAASGAKATTEMRALARIVGFLDARDNEVFRFFIGPIVMWDLHGVLALERWRARVGRSVRVWFEVLGEMEALSSLATFAYENPSYVLPDLGVDARYEADALAHPLIREDKRVVNDVRLAGPGTALVITGSNMSGKSTLLRAMGINAVLALAGAPVCATRLALGPVKIVTSMRVKDSLESGVSHFYAEVEKLKRVLDVSRGETKVLFLLDEILHGTNSRERLIGARAVVRELLRCGALGGVSTHDLGIGDLETSLPTQVKNVHFQEQVEGDRMTFDYKLRGGIVTSSNALRLMRMVGIDVVPLDDGGPV